VSRSDGETDPTWLAMGVGLAVLWLFVRGTPWMSDFVRFFEEALLGLAIGLPIAYLTRRMYADRIPFSDPVRSPAYAVVYVVFFLWELVTANVDVAYRVVRPSMPIHPDVVELPLRVETDLAVTTIANSITLTPGTLTMDYDDERNAIYVHAIDARDREKVVEPIRRWEDYALVIFDERRSPGDPVPDPDHTFEDARADDATPEDGGDEDGE